MILLCHFKKNLADYSIVLPTPAPTGMWRYRIIYNGHPPQTTYFAVNKIGSTFTGSGNWNISTNWANNSKPPATVPPGHEILINPVAGDECFLTEPQTISSDAKIIVIAGKMFRMNGNLVIQ